ncbi:MAG TPA: pseudouridine synthase [Patescibacteria group bacterium]|nr:pseudouridine synthase [Patescibacteria group bacterium]
MRINKYVALATGLSRRAADKAIRANRVKINGMTAVLGSEVKPTDQVAVDGTSINTEETVTILLNKPVGYVCSRNGQGSKTVYDLLPEKYHSLKTVGRLDRDSSGLILLTNDGDLANKLTHPKYEKEKTYQVKLNKPLSQADKNKLLTGVELEDGLSKFIKVNDSSDGTLEIIMSEGRNRQIRRSLDMLDYQVESLHRISFGPYRLENLSLGKFIPV